MSGIAKTVVNKEQYLQARKFWEDTKQLQIVELGHLIYINENGFDKYQSNIQSLWSPTIQQDIWLAKHCKLDFIQERLHEQYSGEWVWHLLDNMKISPQVEIIEIHNDSNIYMNLKEVKLNKILFYGTTFFLKVLNDVIQIVSGQKPTMNTNVCVDFRWNGLYISYFNKGKEYVSSGGIIEITQLDVKLPKITHSYNLRDIKKYSPDNIFLSFDNGIDNIKYCKDIELPKSKLNLAAKQIIKKSLPQYIQQFIKN